MAPSHADDEAAAAAAAESEVDLVLHPTRVRLQQQAASSSTPAPKIEGPRQRGRKHMTDDRVLLEPNLSDIPEQQEPLGTWRQVGQVDFFRFRNGNLPFYYRVRTLKICKQAVLQSWWRQARQTGLMLMVFMLFLYLAGYPMPWQAREPMLAAVEPTLATPDLVPSPPDEDYLVSA